MKLLRLFMLAATFGIPGLLFAQYNLEEFGIELGPGLVLLQNKEQSAIGPTANANAFFSHYACGKAYGFHISAGAFGMRPTAKVGNDLLDGADNTRTSLTFSGIDIAVLGKLRLHEYHRPKEWAVFLGPRLQLPFLARYHTGGINPFSGPLKLATQSLSRLWPGVELSMQFRQPIGKKKSWFVHPGAVFFVLPAFQTQRAGNAQPFYFFLNFGYAFWDQRG